MLWVYFAVEISGNFQKVLTTLLLSYEWLWKTKQDQPGPLTGLRVDADLLLLAQQAMTSASVYVSALGEQCDITFMGSLFTFNCATRHNVMQTKCHICVTLPTDTSSRFL
jgi:hypothetical protein